VSDWGKKKEKALPLKPVKRNRCMRQKGKNNREKEITRVIRKRKKEKLEKCTHVEMRGVCPRISEDFKEG